MARKRPHLAGIGAIAVLALLLADDRNGWGESAAPSLAAKSTEKEKVPGKVPEKSAAQTPAGVSNRIPLPRARPQQRLAAVSSAGAAVPAIETSPRAPLPPAASLAVSAEDLATLKQAIGLARNSKTGRASDLQKTINDPLARKLVEWVLLRSDNNTADFSRYAAFISANQSWPSINTLRRKSEAMLWQEQPDPAFVRAAFAKPPLSAKGHFAFARALLALGDRAGAQAQVRETWRNDAFGMDLEDDAFDAFKDLLTAADHRTRMDMRFYAEDVDAGLRAASRAGPTAQAIAKAWAAVIRKAANAKALLEAVPAEASGDAAYTFIRAQFLRREDKAAEAAAFLLSLPRDGAQPIDVDQWWVERRLVARKLLDLGDARTAYRVASETAPTSKEGPRWEQPFTAGWIALRFLDDPATAMAHFAKVAQGSVDPTTLARAGYWQGRAAEALGKSSDARGYYEAAARYTTAYYGQLARARLGYQDIVLRAPPELSPERRATIAQVEIVRAAELLYAIGERDLAVPFAADLGERSTDIAALAELGEVAARNGDARCTLLIGKAALKRGYALEHYAFPTIGIPDYRGIGPAVDTSIIYSIARQESQFWQGDVSTAKAMGLMQVTPEAAHETSKKFGAAYDLKRLASDTVYNVQMGAAELGDLLDGYRGSYILTFAGYNAGRGSVHNWISHYGDPRDPKVDPVDWVERIPFSETRNYVERVLENLQVYRVRLGGGPRLMIEADLHRGAAAD
ncbi:MAG TPA: lytic transglycosylase domain-containing protein [Xanthobacteraceae bacterium]